MIEPFIVFGGLLFWGITAVLFLFTVAFMSSDNHGKAFFSIVAWAAIIVLFTNAKPFEWLSMNWQYVAYATMGYVILGIAHMVVRWQLLCGKVAKVYSGIREDFLKDLGLGNISEANEQQIKDLKRTALSSYALIDLRVKTLPMEVGGNISRLTGWFMFWPFSLLSYAIGDLLVQFGHWTVETFSSLMQKISDRQFKKFTEFD